MGARIAIAVAAGVLGLVCATTANAVQLSRTESTLLQAINQTRAAHGLPPLRVDPKLVRAARAHSRDMLRRDYFGHGPVGPRLMSFGVTGTLVGENIAWAARAVPITPVVIGGWMASPPHRANLLRPMFRRIGIAAPVGEFVGLEGASVVTADFAG